MQLNALNQNVKLTALYSTRLLVKHVFVVKHKQDHVVTEDLMVF